MFHAVLAIKYHPVIANQTSYIDENENIWEFLETKVINQEYGFLTFYSPLLHQVRKGRTSRLLARLKTTRAARTLTPSLRRVMAL